MGKDIVGRVHEVETCGTVDGPGIRYVIFMQGCPLRCLYCHNPDSIATDGGRKVTADDLMEDILKYAAYMRFSGGGVTISGGEPLMQPRFVQEIFRRCKEHGIHTALDTSGYVLRLETIEPVLQYVDLVLLDVKSSDEELYTRITSRPLQPTLDFARYLSERGKKMWVRFVLVPGLTDGEGNIEGVARFVAMLSSVERLEVLPFHKMGEYKWEALGYEYTLGDTRTPSPEEVAAAEEIFRGMGVPL
jgi:pyruvate formate lyase activating enzyme